MPSNAGLQYRLGLSLYLHGRPAEAEQALRAACAWNRTTTSSSALALFLDKYARYDEALEVVERALKIMPDHPEYVQVRDMLNEKRKRPPPPQ